MCELLRFLTRTLNYSAPSDAINRCPSVNFPARINTKHCRTRNWHHHLFRKSVHDGKWGGRRKRFHCLFADFRGYCRPSLLCHYDYNHYGNIQICGWHDRPINPVEISDSAGPKKEMTLNRRRQRSDGKNYPVIIFNQLIIGTGMVMATRTACCRSVRFASSSLLDDS